MIEDEAKTKWCPFSRVRMEIHEGLDASGKLLDIPSSCNRNPRARAEPLSYPLGAECIASACMAWRKYTSAIPEGDGYCGLAGTP